ncbi:uroporphyrinogen-III synthase [Pseudorhodoferax sp.]|uniref:uroporphyrinogen-III synthase n=1 Tax=Pseudorhodoferax sp. TaxID=1993553 RepID=UPI002DD66E55|nr:uroporphyrinogen-III synthase [Pseudorhodoferax sp.]
MRVLVTRPLREALHWCEQLRARGVAAEPLPLIDITATDPVPVAAAWAGLAGCHAAMFVSANAAEAFFAARPAAAAWPAQVGAWATGPGTARALQLAGVPAAALVAPAADAPQFDSETLWRLVGGDPALAGARVLIVRGADADGRPSGRPWLAAQLEAAGAQVHELAAYARRRPAWDAATHAQAAAATAALWLFSSSDAVRHLQQLLPNADWRGTRALATHARIAEAARDAGFGQVQTVRPVLDDMVASIESQR